MYHKTLIAPRYIWALETDIAVLNVYRGALIPFLV